MKKEIKMTLVILPNPHTDMLKKATDPKKKLWLGPKPEKKNTIVSYFIVLS